MVGPEKPRLSELPGTPVFTVASWMPKGTICAPTDQAPRSLCVHKGLIILDLGNDLTMEHLVLSTNTDDQNVRCPFEVDLHKVAMTSNTTLLTYYDF